MAMEILVTLPDGETRDVLVPPDHRSRLEDLGDVEWNESTEQFTSPELADRLAGVDVCVTGWGTPTLDAAVLANADDLELVTHIGGSVASVGSEALYDRGISLCSANEVLAGFVSEAVLAYALAALREIPAFDAEMKAGGWGKDRERTETLFGADVGFVGLGAVGRQLLPLLEPFDATVRVYDPYVDAAALPGDARKVDLGMALSASDVVSIHVPKTPETLHMLGAAELAELRDGALLVNCARGAIVEEDALVEELESGRISAVLDVYDEEPLPEDHPLRDAENATLLPHVAGLPARENMTEAMIEEIARFRAGEPLLHAQPRERFETMTRDWLSAEDAER